MSVSLLQLPPRPLVNRACCRGLNPIGMLVVVGHVCVLFEFLSVLVKVPLFASKVRRAGMYLVNRKLTNFSRLVAKRTKKFPTCWCNICHVVPRRCSRSSTNTSCVFRCQLHLRLRAGRRDASSRQSRVQPTHYLEFDSVCPRSRQVLFSHHGGHACAYA